MLSRARLYGAGVTPSSACGLGTPIEIYLWPDDRLPVDRVFPRERWGERIVGMYVPGPVDRIALIAWASPRETYRILVHELAHAWYERSCADRVLAESSESFAQAIDQLALHGCYDFVLSVKSKFNWLRHRMGFGYWSLSKYLKQRVKKAVDFMFQFEKNLAQYCKKRGFDGVICGHIHHAEIKDINGVIYMNDGDWVESCTALVEHHNGTWEIVTWTKSNDQDNSYSN